MLGMREEGIVATAASEWTCRDCVPFTTRIGSRSEDTFGAFRQPNGLRKFRVLYILLGGVGCTRRILNLLNVDIEVSRS